MCKLSINLLISSYKNKQVISLTSVKRIITTQQEIFSMVTSSRTTMNNSYYNNYKHKIEQEHKTNTMMTIKFTLMRNYSLLLEIHKRIIIIKLIGGLI